LGVSRARAVARGAEPRLWGKVFTDQIDQIDRIDRIDRIDGIDGSSRTRTGAARRRNRRHLERLLLSFKRC